MNTAISMDSGRQIANKKRITNNEDRWVDFNPIHRSFELDFNYLESQDSGWRLGENVVWWEKCQILFYTIFIHNLYIKGVQLCRYLISVLHQKQINLYAHILHFLPMRELEPRRNRSWSWTTANVNGVITPGEHLQTRANRQPLILRKRTES